jgi:peptidyl-dipeptidase Dcp
VIRSIARAIVLSFTLAALASAAPPQAPRKARPVTSPNPLLLPWSGPYGGVPPWDQVKLGLWKPAVEAAIAERQQEIAKIVAQRAAPTFANTIVAMERVGRTLDRVERMFGVMTDNLTTPEIQALDRELAPRISAAQDEITFDEGLFARIAAVYEARAALPPEARRLTERVHARFVRSGARLDAAGKARLSAINQELASSATRSTGSSRTWSTRACPGRRATSSSSRAR